MQSTRWQEYSEVWTACGYSKLRQWQSVLLHILSLKIIKLKDEGILSFLIGNRKGNSCCYNTI